MGVLIHDHMRRLRVRLRHNHVASSMNTRGFIERPLLGNEVGVLRYHGRNGLIARVLVVGVALRKSVLLGERLYHCSSLLARTPKRRRR